jgi:hypothetical protein
MTSSDTQGDNGATTQSGDVLCFEDINNNSYNSNDKTKMMTSSDKKGAKGDNGANTTKKEFTQLSKKFLCKCGKTFSHRQNLHVHKKKNCKLLYASQTTKNDVPLTSTELLAFCSKTITDTVLEQTSVLFKSLTTNTNYIQNNTNNFENANNDNSTLTNTNNNNNSHNKTFNLQFFLTHTCKDAMNISDFINSIDLQVNDFEEVGEKGFVNGISSIIIKKLNALDEHMRPVHCSDLKRESVYIKENNQWKKDTNNNEGLKKVIKAVAYKNTALSPAFKAKYPDYGISTSKSSDRYNRAMIESHGGSGNNDETNLDKIVKRITKEILISKE